MIVYNLTRTSLVALVLLNFILGCKENSQSIKGEKIPQNKSELYDLNFSGVSLKVEVAALPEERELGLMFRNSLKENEGMLFVFKEGNIINSGDHDFLINDCEEYKSLYKKQLQ